MCCANRMSIGELYLLIEREKSFISIQETMKRLIETDVKMSKRRKRHAIDEIENDICMSQFILAKYLPRYRDELDFHLKNLIVEEEKIRKAYHEAKKRAERATASDATDAPSRPDAQPDSPGTQPITEEVQVS